MENKVNWHGKIRLNLIFVSILPRVISLTAVFIVLVLMTGCAVGPNFQRPTTPTVDRYTQQPLPAQTASVEVKGGEAQRFVQDMDIPGQWWTLFRSKPLNDLIEHALKANPDMEAAQAALRIARENVYAQQGAFFPSVEANFNPTRQKTAGVLTSPLANGNYIYSLHTAQVTVAYVPDVFGGIRRQVESLKAQADSQRFQLKATYLTLTSNVVATAVQEAALRGQIAATKRIIDIQSQSLELLQHQFELGQIASGDVVAQEAALAQVQAMLPPLEKQLAQQRDMLARLAGRFPTESLVEEFALSSLHLPQELPVSLPSKLVEQRPDVRSAEEQLHAASAEIGVSIANRLPNITLSANAGSSATAISQLFTSGTGFWGLAGNLTQPIFQGGTLLHRQRAAEAAYDQAAAQYRSVVLTAFQNVADTLHAIQSDADALKASVAAERAADKSLSIAHSQLELGNISYLALLNAEQTYQQAMINLVQALANRYADTAALFQALGGGWWNGPDFDTAAQTVAPAGKHN
jgi:NodT family efflux transporter outer membrane factor (OMF) lipoprotein